MVRRLKTYTPGRGYTKEDWNELSDSHAPTEAQLAEARPFSEVFPEMAAEIEEILKRGRGRQKAPTKELISLRVDQDVLAAYRATGAGWQARMNNVLRAALDEKE